jgi:tRNA U38,U39,U40 pseudouridine synthase TruA
MSKILRTRYHLDIAYLGTRFAGLQRQPGVRTVQGALESAAAKVTLDPGNLSFAAAGRTDAGVHATAQSVTIELVRKCKSRPRGHDSGSRASQPASYAPHRPRFSGGGGGGRSGGDDDGSLDSSNSASSKKKAAFSFSSVASSQSSLHARPDTVAAPAPAANASDLATATIGPLSPSAVQRAINAALLSAGARDVQVQRARLAPPGFHARHSAVAREYVYKLAVDDWGAPVSVLTGDRFWRVFGKPDHTSFDFDAMRRAAEVLVGEHDFAAFRSAGCSSERSPHGAVRRVSHAEVRDVAFDLATAYALPWDPACNARDALAPRDASPLGLVRGIEFRIKANGFVFNQVRRLAWVLRSVGMGVTTHQEVGLMLSRGRGAKLSTGVAPPHGLYFTGVDYGPGN